MALAGEVLELLSVSGATLGVAESLTGGLLTSTLVAVPGASAVLRGGLVAYTTEMKHTLLGVDLDLLARVGAVHPEIAAAMATGARDRLDATWAVATTGVAGPEPQDGQPVGTVHVAVAGPDQVNVSLGLVLPGGRAAIRQAAVGAALELLLDHLRDQRDDQSVERSAGESDGVVTRPSATRVAEPLGTVNAP